MNKVELLAPAGNYESFVGAIAAGADAVYIGGRMYGARAYADNFSDEEVCRAIRYAHLCSKKIYMTINTLMKQSEIDELADYMRPFYEEGLDGVIVQDMGAICLFKEQFPKMEIHASTQLTITGVYGAQYLKDLGVTRVVPARECSLEEMRRIREDAGIEVEAFIHGAMCYSYSGQCLFSSMLGGRSGNRGRCAQPCRLPYQVTSTNEASMHKGSSQKEIYPLSLKDMCTLSVLPDLLEAGIDSFKIEGRMKSPEYAAGVTALYRKYIDLYYLDPNAPYNVDPDDLKALMSLYIRSDIQDGYYFNHNGKEMITPGKPGYLKTDDALLKKVRERYLSADHAPSVQAAESVYLTPGETSVLVLTAKDASGADVTVSVTGDLVDAAQKSPLTEDAVRKQLIKTGDSAFTITHCDVILSGDVFMPVKALNALRRAGLTALEDALLAPFRRGDHACEAGDSAMRNDHVVNQTESGAYKPYLAAEVRTSYQLHAVLEEPCIDRVYVDADLLLSDEASFNAIKVAVGKEIYVSMPYILRARDKGWLSDFRKQILESDHAVNVSGILVRNTESLGYLKQMKYSGKILCDAGLYAWNREARLFWNRQGYAFTYPLECNREDLAKPGVPGEMIIYGRAPLMLTANCVRKTCFSCDGKGADYLYLHDRYHTTFPVLTDCRHCTNVIYNSLPLSLHAFSRQVQEIALGGRLSFTTEDANEVRDVLSLYHGYFREDYDRNGPMPFAFTKGHYKRGAE